MTTPLRLTTATTTPYDVTITTLIRLEKTVAESEHDALHTRWLFGRELAKQRTIKRGKLVIDRHLVLQVMTQCKLGEREIKYRVQFAVKYPTDDLRCNAIASHPSWWAMTQKGLVEKPRSSTPSVKAPTAAAWRRMLSRLHLFLEHPESLPPDQVDYLGTLAEMIQNTVRYYHVRGHVRPVPGSPRPV